MWTLRVLQLHIQGQWDVARQCLTMHLRATVSVHSARAVRDCMQPQSCNGLPCTSDDVMPSVRLGYSQDKKFPPTHAAIGAWENKSPEQIDSEIKWWVLSALSDRRTLRACSVRKQRIYHYWHSQGRYPTGGGLVTLWRRAARAGPSCSQVGGGCQCSGVHWVQSLVCSRTTRSRWNPQLRA